MKTMRKRLMRAAALLLTLIMAGTVFAGCGSVKPDGDTKIDESTKNPKKDTKDPEGQVLKLQWFQSMGIDSIFETPWKDERSLYSFMVFDALLSENADNTFIGRLASDWSVSDDALTYTFTIRNGVKWHDGEPFTIDDVVWTMTTLAKLPEINMAKSLAYVEGFDAAAQGKAAELSGISVQDNVLNIRLTSPRRGFLNSLCRIRILPKHLLGNVELDKLASDESYWSKPIGTGCYKIDEVSFPDYFTVVANEDYFGNVPSIKKVLFTSYDTGGNDAVVSALIAGDLDFAWGNEINDIEVASNIVEQNSDMVIKLQNALYCRGLVFNLGDRADGKIRNDIRDAKVRRAINLLIDKEAIASFYKGQATPLPDVIAAEDYFYNDDIAPFKRDIDAAKTLLKEADFDFSTPLELAYYYNDQTTADIMMLLTQNLAEAGITLHTNLLQGDLATLIYEDSNYDMLYCAFGGESESLQVFQQMTTSSTFTYMGADEERGRLFDQLYKDYNSATNDFDAKKYGDKMQFLNLENCYFIGLYSQNTIELYNSKKLFIPEEVFKVEDEYKRNWKFDEWKFID